MLAPVVTGRQALVAASIEIRHIPRQMFNLPSDGQTTLDDRAEKSGTTLQTLRRGMETLSLVAQHPEGLSIAQLAERLSIDRAIVYRIVATLEAGAFISRGPKSRIYLGGAVLELSAGLEPQLRSFAAPFVNRLARDAHAASFLSVAHATNATAILVAESQTGLIRVGYRVGSSHPLDRGAAGIAILANRPEKAEDTDAVRQARKDGYSITRGQLQINAVGIAAPIRFAKRGSMVLEASVGVVALNDLDVDDVAPRVIKCAHEIARFMAA